MNIEQNSSVCLKNERKRLKFTQKALAEQLNVSDMTIKRYETGTPIPSDKLAILANLGFDVSYLLTGVRSVQSLSAEEQLILDKYRSAETEVKHQMLLLLLGGSVSQGIHNSPNSSISNSFNR